MSASLVGSEMCIRDRLIGHAHQQARLARNSSVGRRFISRFAGETDRFPVSYTHLTLPTICSV
eukprot:7066479-Alexandrium_andersonii.AAC.1